MTTIKICSDMIRYAKSFSLKPADYSAVRLTFTQRIASKTREWKVGDMIGDVDDIGN